MAQRAIIGINGDLLPFDDTLDKIQTQGIGGGSVTWVPEAATRCETLRVTANGSYSAETAGVYGWDNVLVSVPGSSVTGKDPDTGEEVEVHPDPETGEIVKTVIPEEIRVTTLPTKTTYANGETIDYTGIVVHGYSSTGRDLGAIPFSELVFPVTTAQGGDEWTDGHGLNAMMLACTPHYGVDWQGHEYTVYVGDKVLGTDGYGKQATYGTGNTPSTRLITRYNNHNYGLLLTGSGKTDMYAYTPQTPGTVAYGWSISGGSTAELNSNRFSNAQWEGYLTDLPVSTVDPTAINPSTLYNIQSIPVQWLRPSDGAVLETSFDITVTGGTP